MDDSSDLAAALGSVAGFLERVDGLPGDLGDAAMALAAEARATEARIASRGDDLLVVLVGPTGAGKSTLLNTIVGRPVSRAGARRPTTAVPVVLASGRRADRYRRDGIAGVATVEVARSDHPLTDHLTFVDAPDPDSVERSHAEALAALVLVADLVVVVTTPARYGDAVPWALLGRVQRLGSIGWVVMNRVRDELEGRLQVGHLVARATAAGYDVAADQVLRLPERPGVGLRPTDVAELADVLVEVGQDDADEVRDHARRRAASLVAHGARAWLDEVEAAVTGEGRRARTAAASSAAERATLTDDLAADPPGQAAHAAALLRLRAGADPEEVVHRLADATVADVDARFGTGRAEAERVVDAALGAAPTDDRLALLLGTADPAARDGFHRSLAEHLVAVGDVAVPVVPAGLEGAVEHLQRLVGRPVPA